VTTRDQWRRDVDGTLDDLGLRPWRHNGYWLTALEIDGRRIIVMESHRWNGGGDRETLTLAFHWVDEYVSKFDGIRDTRDVLLRHGDSTDLLRQTVTNLVQDITYPTRHPEHADTYWTLLNDGHLDLADIVAVCEQLAPQDT
jgi:hypothetical protein